MESHRLAICKITFWAATLAVSWMLAKSTARAQAPVPLGSLSPATARAEDLRQEVNPRVRPGVTVRDRVAKSLVQFVMQSTVNYAIPAGQQSFSAVLLYTPAEGIKQGPDPTKFNRIRVRFLVDGKLLLECIFDHTTPPVEFTIPVAGGRLLTIRGDDEFGRDSFFLLDPQFSPASAQNSARYLISKDEGYVAFTPQPRQSLFHVFRPGESVPVQAYFRGSAHESAIQFIFKPEQVVGATTAELRAELRPAGSDLLVGEATWKVPPTRGPAQLEVVERIQEKIVYDRTTRIAIIPAVDLGGASDSVFGVHISSEGYPFLQDEFADLWGAKWGRVFLRWPVIEATAGHFDFSRADRLIDIYRALNMRVLGVLGEDAPAWAGSPGPDYLANWKSFVSATVSHFRGKIDHWDLFNEVDNKYHSKFFPVDPNIDLTILKTGAEAVRQSDSSSKIVCCSTGSADWLGYDRRIFSAGLLQNIDITSLHPYRVSAPEDKEGVFTYLEELNALETLVNSDNASKTIWSTEANWILGPAGATYVTAPDMDEHTQAEYVVRTNLLSFGRKVPYFLHMPFFHSHRTELHLDTLAAYSQMASWLSNATPVRILNPQPEIFGVVGGQAGQIRGSLWSLRSAAVVKLSGLSQLQWADFYGNPISIRADSIALTPAPIYFSAPGSALPELTVVTPPPPRAWTALPAMDTWQRFPNLQYEVTPQGVHVTSPPSQWATSLVSPPLTVQRDTCYEALFDLGVLRGGVGVFATAPTTERHLREGTHLFYVDGKPHRVAVHFQTESEESVRLVIQDANSWGAEVTEFLVSNPGLATCQGNK